MIQESFPACLRDLLQRRNMRITTWAKRVGISQGYASNLCTGRRVPSLEFIDAWADDLGLDTQERRRLWNSALLSRLGKEAEPRLSALIAAEHTLYSTTSFASPGAGCETPRPV